MEEKAKEKEAYKVEILSQDFISVFPRLREEHRQVLVTYSYAELPPATITIDLFELFKEDQFVAADQIRARKGPFFEKFLEARAKAIREDIERRLIFKPETIEV